MSNELMNVSPVTVEQETTQTNTPRVLFKTIKAENVFDAMKIANAINSPDSLADIPSGTVLHVTDIIGTKGIRKGRNGMPDVDCINTIFMLDDGTSLFTQSDGISRSVEFITTIFPNCGREQGMPYLPIAIEEKTMKSGNTLKTAVMKPELFNQA